MLRRAAACLAVCLLLNAQTSAAPGAAALVAPSGEVTGSTIVFTWNAVAGATWYQFWIGTTAGVALQQWFTAEQAHCPNGGTCSITLTLGFGGGAYNWYVQTWNQTGAGAWSASMGLTIKDTAPIWSRKLPNDRRYALAFDGLAVLDNETGLTWVRTPSANIVSYGFASVLTCPSLTLGGRMGWRLPSLSEQLSVTDPFTTEGLPAGHPFNLGATAPIFWTTTGYPTNTNIVAIVQITDLSGIYFGDKVTDYKRVWCVRGPGSERTGS